MVRVPTPSVGRGRGAALMVLLLVASSCRAVFERADEGLSAGTAVVAPPSPDAGSPPPGPVPRYRLDTGSPPSALRALPPPPAPEPTPPAPPTTAVPPTPTSPDPVGVTVWYVAPGADGDCTAASPCGDAGTAVARAAPGDRVELAAGTYGEQWITHGGGEPGAPVVVAPAPGARVVVARVDSAVPHLVVEDLTVSGVVYLRPGADGDVVRRVTAHGAYVTGADRTAWFDNRLLQGGPGDDIMQIKGLAGDDPVGLTAEGNVLGPAWRSGSSHTDCVQILGGDDIVFARNVLYECSDKAFQIRSGAGGTVGRVRLERNVFGECRPRRDGCDGYHAVVWAAEGSNSLELIHNSIAGSVAVSSGGSTTSSLDGLVQYGNIAESLPCSPRTDANLVARDPCGPSDLVGSVAWLDPDPAVMDLHLAPGPGPAIDRGSPVDPGPDIDGEGICGAAADLGADELC